MKMKMIATAALCGSFLLSASAMMAEDAKPGKARGTAPASATALPSGAVMVSPGTYTHTDAEGKKWIYRQTPFGMAKFEDRERPATDQESEQKRIQQIRAVEDGDSVRFERPGPFGVYRWKQKKTELNALERAAWERARTQQSPREKE